MRRILFIIPLFLLIALPVRAEQVDVQVTFNTIVEFTVNNGGPFTFTYDEYADFGAAQDLGDVDYDLYVNQAWQVDGQILDGTQNGQTAADWDDAGWTLSVNGVTIDEASTTTVDSGGAAVERTGSLWEVLLTVPWPESNSTADCTIELTASAV
ncbi:MAG TPA: hypothetical protein VGB30_02230 [bacterium]|jgi:hypothetical protein